VKDPPASIKAIQTARMLEEINTAFIGFIKHPPWLSHNYPANRSNPQPASKEFRRQALKKRCELHEFAQFVARFP